MYSLFASETKNVKIVEIYTKRKQASFTSVKGAIFMPKIQTEKENKYYEQRNIQLQTHRNKNSKGTFLS